MSDLVVRGICLFQQKSREKDVESTVFSKDEGFIYVRLTSSLKGGRLNLPLASTSELYLSSRSALKHYILRDVKVISTHDSIILDYEKLECFSFLSKVMLHVAKYNLEASYSLVEMFINLLDEGLNRILLTAHAIERIFVNEGIFGDYQKCPFCEKMYEGGEVIGYSYEHNCSCCSSCANVINVLSSKLRNYLRVTQTLTLRDAVRYPLNDVDPIRLLSFECFRLKKLLKNQQDEIDEFLERVKNG